MNPGITCPNCLSEIQEKSEFCSQWGHRLAAQKRGGIVWYWLGILLVVCCAIAWVFLLLGIADDREGWADAILGGVIISVIPLALGIFLIKKRRKGPSHSADSGDGAYYQNPEDDRRYR